MMFARLKFSLVFIIAIYSSNIMAAILDAQEGDEEEKQPIEVRSV